MGCPIEIINYGRMQRLVTDRHTIEIAGARELKEMQDTATKLAHVEFQQQKMATFAL